MKRVAILYICTGRYTIFWKDFFLSMETHFLKDCYIEYFVFTDGDIALINQQVNIIEFNHLGWPLDALMRYRMFCEMENELESFDYLFFLNANMLVLEEITSAILPLKEDFLGVIHPGFYNKGQAQFTYERNALSLACMKMTEGEHYFMSGFSGGKARPFLQLCHHLAADTDKDLQKGIVAIWHDESYLNKYYWNHKDSVKVLEPSFGYPQDWVIPFEKKILIRDKNYYGGHAFLRRMTDEYKKHL